ncbi:ABC transporter ATP-binding protein [Caloranaerobacter azorensis]|nr:ABC transporter ATP-binding protein [Caloranaerobacter azorensis]
MDEILTLKPEHNGTKIIDDIDSIELKDLYFSYNNKRELYFGLNFSLKKGKIYCLKGENGSGKSTLIDIITGLIYDYKGDVLYNNISIKELDANYLRRHLISIVEQEPDLINIPLKENLTFGIKSYDRDYLKRLCSEFYIEKRIDSHNENLDLSGGEKQKIAFSKRNIKKAKIYDIR